MSEDPEERRKRNKREDPSSPSTSDDEREDGLKTRLDWRMKAKETHSDWTIEILVNGKSHCIYPVHKNALSVGSNRSEYFVRLFQNEICSEHKTSTSRLEMEEPAAQAFPTMLDYLYSLWEEDDKPPITHETCTALHSLGRYFEIRGLRKKARQFRNKYMTIESCHVYYRHAKLFRDDSTLQAVVALCCNEMIAGPSHKKLVHVTDAQFWLDVLQHNSGKPNPILSEWIAGFCVEREKDHSLRAETFLKLTNDSVLPKLSSGAAVHLLEIGNRILPSSPDSSDAGKLTGLQERTVEALTSNWESIDQSTLQQLGQHNPLVLSKVMTMSLVKAQEELSTTREKLVEAERSVRNMGNFLPSSVVVSGAGSSKVNGTYTRMNTFSNSAPQFSKNDYWEGVWTEFWIHLAGGGHWYLSIENEREYSDCYSYDPDPDSPVRLPPKNGLEESDRGRSPAPALTYLFDDD